MWLAGQQLVDRGVQGVGVVEVGFIEREIGWIGQAAGGPYQFGM